MGEIAIFLGRFLQAVDDAMEFADGAVAVRRGKFRHPLAAHTAPQPNDYATVGPLRRRRSDPTRRIVPVRTPTPADPTPADLFLAFGLMQEFAGPRPKRLAPQGQSLAKIVPRGRDHLSKRRLDLPPVFLLGGTGARREPGARLFPPGVPG